MRDHLAEGLDEEITKGFEIQHKEGKLRYSYQCRADAVYGLGERYCSVNHKGKKLVSRVVEQFTMQNEHTYFPIPFYHASDGHGVFVSTMCEVVFTFGSELYEIEMDEDAPHTLHFFYGSAQEIIRQFVEATGVPVLPPKWAFGVWASANRWNCQTHIEEQLQLMEKHEYPISVMVIEAWSDEATFYIWNGAEYRPCKGEERLSLENFTFHEPWPDPAHMIHQLHEKGIRVILWQIPALKLMEEGRFCMQHEVDCAYAEKEELLVKDRENNPYRIPRQWFIGSMVPDYTNERTCKWWEAKRRYLLEEMGVDGFKTDGGEFIHDDDTFFAAGYDGRQGRNAYPALYENAYQNMIGEKRVLFSRAGYIGSQQTPIHWAGDQVSSFGELESVLHAGLSLSLSGIPFWSFDIAGFAGPLPDKELYLRATALAAFVPAMQWHSESANGQFEEIMKGSGGINDRSPWNVAAASEDREILSVARYFANLHMNFLPYFYSEAKKAAASCQPFMKHLVLDYGEDQRAALCEDEYMIGDLLIAPIVSRNTRSREVYLPEGTWYEFPSGKKQSGGCFMQKEADLHSIPLYLREKGAVVLNLDHTCTLGSYVSGAQDTYDHLCLICADEKADYYFTDDLGNDTLLCADQIAAEYQIGTADQTGTADQIGTADQTGTADQIGRTDTRKGMQVIFLKDLHVQNII